MRQSSPQSGSAVERESDNLEADVANMQSIAGTINAGPPEKLDGECPMTLYLNTEAGCTDYKERCAAAESNARELAQDLKIAAAEGVKPEEEVLQLRAEAQAVRNQVQYRGRQTRVKNKHEAIEFGKEKTDEGECMMFESEMESLDHMEGMCFERDWHVTELRAAAAAGMDAAQTEQHVAEAEDRPPLKRNIALQAATTNAETSIAQLASVLNDKPQMIRSQIPQDVQQECKAGRSQSLRTGIKSTSETCKDSASHASKLAQDLQEAVAAGENQDGQVRESWQAAEALSEQVGHEQQQPGHQDTNGPSLQSCEQLTELSRMCFERDWQITEFQAASSRMRTTSQVALRQESSQEACDQKSSEASKDALWSRLTEEFEKECAFVRDQVMKAELAAGLTCQEKPRKRESDAHQIQLQEAATKDMPTYPASSTTVPTSDKGTKKLSQSDLQALKQRLTSAQAAGKVAEAKWREAERELAVARQALDTYSDHEVTRSCDG